MHQLSETEETVASCIRQLRQEFCETKPSRKSFYDSLHMVGLACIRRNTVFFSNDPTACIYKSDCRKESHPCLHKQYQGDRPITNAKHHVDSESHVSLLH